MNKIKARQLLHLVISGDLEDIKDVTFKDLSGPGHRRCLASASICPYSESNPHTSRHEQ